ncbi:hypothetical protein A5634_13690 [Mycobacterium asiaticum]|uniref:Uncharacterized protein n=1 Tax=Mycobacterium asiaticum TaxID=1790 RepID=A0A1A3PBM0_MYCAS|nr:hypothetical protein [Mycobacterium asiaticum]OBK31623.1 hypothetical protein A5634_13690 [Mycobacterium asiaticum]
MAPPHLYPVCADVLNNTSIAGKLTCGDDSATCPVCWCEASVRDGAEAGNVDQVDTLTSDALGLACVSAAEIGFSTPRQSERDALGNNLVEGYI